MIRPARPQYAPGIARVHVQSWQETYPGLIAQDHLDKLEVSLATERWIRRIGARVARIFVSEENGRIVGFTSGGPPQQPELGYDSELYTLYLLREEQGKGLGRQLFEALAEAMRAQGHATMYCWVVRGNPAAEFYRRQGGKRGTEKIVEIGGQPVTEDLFLWRLS